MLLLLEELEVFGLEVSKKLRGEFHSPGKVWFSDHCWARTWGATHTEVETTFKWAGGSQSYEEAWGRRGEHWWSRGAKLFPQNNTPLCDELVLEAADLNRPGLLSAQLLSPMF